MGNIQGIGKKNMTAGFNEKIQSQVHSDLLCRHGTYSACLTWVGNRGDGDFVVGFTAAETCDNILNPPKLLSDLDLLLLLT